LIAQSILSIVLQFRKYRWFSNGFSFYTKKPDKNCKDWSKNTFLNRKVEKQLKYLTTNIKLQSMVGKTIDSTIDSIDTFTIYEISMVFKWFFIFAKKNLIRMARIGRKYLFL